jgi:photosystem II stability/assembly factor-like uncharacterized protein
MKRPWLIFVCAVAALFAVSASAEYGTWEKVYSLDAPPGLSNAAFLSLGIGDVDNLYTAGLQQTGSMEITYGWDSHDGGASWSPLIVASPSGSDCGILDLFSFTLAAAARDANTAAFAGLRASPECVESHEFPACLFACIFQLEPVIYLTLDGGVTIETATLNGTGLLQMIMAMLFVDDTLGYAAGAPAFLLRTQDGGLSWNKIPGPGGITALYNDVQFLDASTGYLVSGIPEEEKSAASDDEARYNHLRHAYRYLKDPLYRLDWRATHDPAALKGQLGRAWRTTDGGETWTQVWEEPGASFLNIEMVDDSIGFILGEPHTGDFPVVLYQTLDGGDTWTDITDGLPQDLPQTLRWAVAALDFQPTVGDVGFIGGAGQNILSFQPVLFYTEDGGANWQMDETVVALENPILQIQWATPKIAYSVGFELSVFRYTQANVPPVADAGADGAGAVGEAIALDGSASFDLDEDLLTYQWVQVGGPTAAIADAGAATTSFVVTEAGDAVFELTVSDTLETDTDTVTFTITAGGDDDDDNNDADDDDTPPPGDDDDNDDDDGCGC